MTKEAAIDEFKSHLEVLKNLKNDDALLWLAYLADLVKNHIGPESDQFQSLVAKPGGEKYYLVYRYDYKYETSILNKKQCEVLVNQYISYINAHGVYAPKDVSKNVFGHWPNEVLFPVLLAVCLAIGGVAYSLGQKEGRLEDAFEIRTKQAKIDSLAKILTAHEREFKNYKMKLIDSLESNLNSTRIEKGVLPR